MYLEPYYRIHDLLNFETLSDSAFGCSKAFVYKKKTKKKNNSSVEAKIAYSSTEPEQNWTGKVWGPVASIVACRQPFVEMTLNLRCWLTSMAILLTHDDINTPFCSFLCMDVINTWLLKQL